MCAEKAAGLAVWMLTETSPCPTCQPGARTSVAQALCQTLGKYRQCGGHVQEAHVSHPEQGRKWPLLLHFFFFLQVTENVEPQGSV